MKVKLILACFIFLYGIILNAQQFKLFFPKDGSYIQIDSIRGNFQTLINWSGYPHSELNFEFTLDNGQSWIPMRIFFHPSSDTTGYWLPPDSSSYLCKVKLSLKSDSSIYVINKSPFTLYFIGYDCISINEIIMWVGNNGMGSHDPRY